MSDKWVIGVDLDGTTVTSKGKHDVGELTVKVFNEMAKQGHKIVIATGRTFEGAQNVYETIGLDHMMINQAGGFIHHPKDESIEKIKTNLNMQIIRKIIEEDEKTKDLVSAFIMDGAYASFVNNSIDDLDTELMLKRAIRASANQEYDFDNTSEDILSGNIIFNVKTNDDLYEIISYLDKNYGDDHHYTKWDVHQDGYLGIEINPSASSKGKAILKVAEMYGISPNNTMGFGDGENDLELISLTAHGVAMANAYDGLKEIANDITKYDNNNDGIAHYLIEKFNLEI